jgi:hypothetical protein
LGRPIPTTVATAPSRGGALGQSFLFYHRRSEDRYRLANARQFVVRRGQNIRIKNGTRAAVELLRCDILITFSVAADERMLAVTGRSKTVY